MGSRGAKSASRFGGKQAVMVISDEPLCKMAEESQLARTSAHGQVYRKTGPNIFRLTRSTKINNRICSRELRKRIKLSKTKNYGVKWSAPGKMQNPPNSAICGRTPWAHRILNGTRTSTLERLPGIVFCEYLHDLDLVIYSFSENILIFCSENQEALMSWSFLLQDGRQ